MTRIQLAKRAEIMRRTKKGTKAPHRFIIGSIVLSTNVNP